MFSFRKTVFIDIETTTESVNGSFSGVQLKSIKDSTSSENQIDIRFPNESSALSFAREENFEVVSKSMALAIEEIFTH